MATLPPEPILPEGSQAPAGDTSPEALAAALHALHGKAETLARLAQLAPERAGIGSAMDATIARAQPWQRALVAQTIEDCGAMLDFGLSALGTLSRRGQDAAAPALVLWREFHAARASMVAVLASEPA